MYYCFAPNHRIASTDHPMNRSLQYSRGYLRNACVGFKPLQHVGLFANTLENSRRKEPEAITSLKREVIWIQPSFLDSKLGGGFKDFYFHPYFRKIPILTSIFQLCWNHQPEIVRNFRDLVYLVIYLQGVSKNDAPDSGSTNSFHDAGSLVRIFAVLRGNDEVGGRIDRFWAVNFFPLINFQGFQVTTLHPLLGDLFNKQMVVVWEFGACCNILYFL